jgi:hypothetical protein
MRIGVDVDGCWDNFGDGVHETLIARGQGHLWKSGPTEKPFWDFYRDWSNDDGTPWTFEQFKELVDWGVDHGIIFSGHWREGGIESLKSIFGMGHELIIINDRSWGSDPMNSQKNTIEAFQRAGVEYDELHFTANKTDVSVDMMVEDKWENFCALMNAGIPTYLITRPWNEAYGFHPNRIKSMAEYADIVEQLTLQKI